MARREGQEQRGQQRGRQRQRQRQRFGPVNVAERDEVGVSRVRQPSRRSRHSRSGLGHRPSGRRCPSCWARDALQLRFQLFHPLLGLLKLFL